MSDLEPGSEVESGFLVGAVTFIPDPKGFDSLLRQRGPVGAALKRWARAVQSAAQRYAPVDTGTLRDSINIEYGKNEDDIWADIGTDVFYAGYQELGTSRNPPHPFLRPALVEAMAELDVVADVDTGFSYGGEGDFEDYGESFGDQ